ncbi:MAG TPA: DEAD/DEAH box helicase family protein, partial [Lamprocystis sp. (in: g-proteobacteria)]|nr:DEAD/DEAH box helicase family protein [Lamprocystis sp. (in: g-proteobacteria)]
MREYPTDVGPADYVLFVDRQALGDIEAKPEDWGHKITTVEDQSGGYASAKLKWVDTTTPLPFVYESTGALTRFTDTRDPKRILFLVDTKNLGEQAEQEFMAFVPNDDHRKFTELYNVQRLKSSFIAKDSQVCIYTIQRMYALLKDQPMDEAAEETNPAEQRVLPRVPPPVVYNSK